MTENNVEKLTGISKVTIKGTVTIPAETRKKFGIKKGDIILIKEHNGEIKLVQS